MADDVFFASDATLLNDLMENNLMGQMEQTISNVRWLYHQSMVWAKNTYYGIQILKCPMDMWQMQEIINEYKPDFIVETGTWYGASALFYAHIFDNIGKGQVITVDNEPKDVPQHPRIHYIVKHCLHPDVLSEIKERVNGSTVMVNLDSDHRKDHVLKEMSLYAPLVTNGMHFIIDDTILNHPSQMKDKNGNLIAPGPYEAVEEFMKDNNEFEYDRTAEKQMITFNVKGYLKRVRGN